MTRKTLRGLITEIVKASPSYMKKEEVRETLENLIKKNVKSQSITTQAELDSFFSDVEMAARALKGVPFEVFQKITKR